MRWHVRHLFAVVLLAAWLCPSGRGAVEISDREALLSPTAPRLAELDVVAQRQGWRGQTAMLRSAAQRAYAANKLTAAAEWLNVCRWSALFAQTEDEFVPHWIAAVQEARVAHRGMSTQYRAHPLTLSAYVSRECQLWLLEHGTFSEEFFAVVRPVDFLPEVLKTLSELHARNGAVFETYANLALAIAVVHDVPPPPEWPHPQVSAEALPRPRPNAVQAFNWWTQQDQRGNTYHKLTQLGADELRFVIDSSAAFDDLEWSQQVANYPLDQLDRAYRMVTYRQDRAANDRPIWTEKDYSLPTILGAGGICVDQAYFAAHVGKARGVPTLLFQGAGSNGRHAWFGFLDSKQRWRLDAGRYAEQRFVTGFARDPQTWGMISDHELQFLAERFRTQRAFRLSQVHAAFAADYLAGGDALAAEAAARKAVAAESRNHQAWEVLLATARALDRSPKQQDEIVHAAMHALDRYPDLEVRYSNLLSQSFRRQGNVKAADAEERRIAKKYEGDRNDLSLQQARAALLRAIATQPVAKQIETYDQTLRTLGRGAGIAFFDQIVVPFVEHLTVLKEYREARDAAERARGVLKVELNSQLEQEFAALLKRVRARG